MPKSKTLARMDFQAVDHLEEAQSQGDNLLLTMYAISESDMSEAEGKAAMTCAARLMQSVMDELNAAVEKMALRSADNVVPLSGPNAG